MESEDSMAKFNRFVLLLRWPGLSRIIQGLGLSQQTAFCPQKAMLAGIVLLA